MTNKEFRHMCDLERKVKLLNRALSNIADHADKALAAAHVNHHSSIKNHLLMINVAVTTVDPNLLPKKLTWRKSA